MKIKVDNAVILAAGRGSRLKNLTKDTPKPLLAPRGKVFIEEIIKKLHEKKINKIYVVVGYKAEQFDYLADKYNVTLLFNNDWEKTNNSSSLLRAKDYLRNTLIINGDIIMNKNPFKRSYKSSVTYVEKNENLNEWIVNVDSKGNIKNFDKDGKGKSGYYQREITFITKELSNRVVEEGLEFNLDEYQEYLILRAAKHAMIPFKMFNVKKNTIWDIDHEKDFHEYSNGI